MKINDNILINYSMGILPNDFKDVKKLFKYVFGTNPFPTNNGYNEKYLIHSYRHHEIYKTRFNK